MKKIMIRFLKIGIRYSWLVVLPFVLTACGKKEGESAPSTLSEPAPSASQEVLSVDVNKPLDHGFVMSPLWKYPAGSHPEISLMFEDNGRLMFKNGFEFYNPSRWQLKDNQLILTIPKIDDVSLTVAEEKIEAGEVLRVDRIKKQIVYQVDYMTDRIDFLGYYFFKITPGNEEPWYN